MTLYVLDSDHTTLHQHGNRPVVQRLAAVPADEVFVSIVTVEEQLRGWLALIRRAKSSERLVTAYSSLHQAVVYYGRLGILDFTESANLHIANLRRQRIRIGTQDLRIAAIALAAGATLLTRIRRDFEKVPGLVVQKSTPRTSGAGRNKNGSAGNEYHFCSPHSIVNVERS